MAMVFLAPMLAGCMDLLSNNSPPTATMTVSPPAPLELRSPPRYAIRPAIAEQNSATREKKKE